MKITKALRQESVALHSAIPLSTPFTFNVTTNNYCNFRCIYCHQSLDKKIVEKHYGKKAALSFSTFQNAVDGMAQFQNRFKVFNFCGTGETLLTPQLPEMVHYANMKGVVERTNIVTNAYALTHSLSDALIDAGLGSLRISIQGLTPEKYEEICGVKLNMEQFLEQISYFYSRKKQCEVHIKIIDIALDGSSADEFYQLFGKYADYIAVEHFIPNQLISYERVGKTDSEFTVHGLKKTNIDVCFSAFYALTLNMNGDIYTCCSNPQAGCLGNVNEMAVYDMWNSQKMHNFWMMQLKNRYSHPICKNCMRPTNAVQEGDNLDPYREEILKRLGEHNG